MPRSIQALLAARLDQLDPSERGVLERGSVEGKVFHRGAVQALAPDETEVPARLVALVRKELLRPDRTQLAGDDAYRFRHLLIRDAAYEALPKSSRADLHERFADWLEEHGADLIELDEILGYHLEQAHRYRLELGPADERAKQLADRAGVRLADAAERADARGDHNAHARLLRRAVALTPDGLASAPLRLRLARVLFFVSETREATDVVAHLLEQAVSAADRAVELLARRELAIDGFWRGAEGAASELEEIGREAIPLFEAAGDDDSLVEAWLAVGLVAWGRCRYGECLAARERALQHARRTGRLHRERQVLAEIGPCLFFGPMPAGEALLWFEEHSWLAQMRPGQAATFHAELLAMLGRFDDARTIAGANDERVRELGNRQGMANAAIARGDIELLAGDVVEAERQIRHGCELYEQLELFGVLSTYAAVWARTLWLLGRDDEAAAQTRRSEKLGDNDDVITQVQWRQERARVLARRGDHVAAQELAREAVARVEQTDMSWSRGEAFGALADVLELSGDANGASAALERALAEYEQKGVIPAIERTQGRLAAFRAPA